MKTFEKFLAQVKRAEQRLISPLEGELNQAPAAVITSEHNFSNTPGTFAQPNAGVVFRKYISNRESAASGIGRSVNPKQINDYLQQHNLSITELINDRLLRERVISGDDTLDVNYLEKGAKAGRAVCRINIYSAEGEEGFGTGFLIAPQLLITNHHVIPDAQYASASYAEFNYEKGTHDLPLSLKVFSFEPSKLFYTNEELDYTVVWVAEESTDGFGKLQEFGYLHLNPGLGKTKEGNFVSIIQHPDGKMKKVALRQNEVTNLSLPKFIRYVTDTKSGSSGAPVFNDKWEVVALHHAGVPRYNAEGKILNRSGAVWDKSQGEVQVDWLENEGVRISSIVYDITTAAAVRFPLLWNYFQPIRNVEDIRKSMGISIDKLDTGNYYPEQDDNVQRQKYYADLENIAAVTLQELHDLLAATHTRHHNYNPSKYVYPLVDLHPDGQIRSIYSNKPFTVQELILADQKVDIDRQLRFIEISKTEKLVGSKDFDAAVEALEAALPYNCEHVVCQSWFNKQEPMRGDLHHLFACESRCNSFRNNFPYRDLPNYPQIESEKIRSECGNVESGFFEPEHNKGIVARAVLYFLVRYPGAIKVYDPASVEVLKNWAKEQPVSLYEKHRNREIFLMQGNRNPFIDYPELVFTLEFMA
jgi:endonuclease I/V8-like Glu-specific endopeptidase